VGRQTLRRLKVAARRRESLFQAEDDQILDENGFFDTGDVARSTRRLHADTDRAKDVIKSGGEWISSIESRISPSTP